MVVNPGFETPFCIHLIGTKHLLISHKALQYGGNAHVIDAHEHSRYEPRNKGNQAQRTDDAVQFIADVMIHGKIGKPSGRGHDEDFSNEHDTTTHIGDGTHTSGIPAIQ